MNQSGKPSLLDKLIIPGLLALLTLSTKPFWWPDDPKVDPEPIAAPSPEPQQQSLQPVVPEVPAAKPGPTPNNPRPAPAHEPLPNSEPSALSSTRIACADHRNSRGESLPLARQVLAQERAAYHKLQRREEEDLPDSHFTNEEKRIGLAKNTVISPQDEQVILSHSPLVEVHQVGGHFEARVLEAGPICP